jgi:RNA recognition motif-containing protein
MSKKLYVGNLPYNVDEGQVREMFEEFGDVESVDMINDRETGRFRGFCFVAMDNAGADAAIEGLNGTQYGGRELKVNEAKPREARPNNYQGGGGGNRNYNRNSGGGGGGNRW